MWWCQNSSTGKISQDIMERYYKYCSKDIVRVGRLGKVMRFAQPSYETFARPCIAPYPSSNHQLPNFYGRGEEAALKRFGKIIHRLNTNNISMFLLVLILPSCVMLFKLLLARLESVFFEYFALEFQFFCLFWKNRMRIISMISEKSSFEGGSVGNWAKKFRK